MRLFYMEYVWSKQPIEVEGWRLKVEGWRVDNFKFFIKLCLKLKY